MIFISYDALTCPCYFDFSFHIDTAFHLYHSPPSSFSLSPLESLSSSSHHSSLLLVIVFSFSPLVSLSSSSPSHHLRLLLFSFSPLTSPPLLLLTTQVSFLLFFFSPFESSPPLLIYQVSFLLSILLPLPLLLTTGVSSRLSSPLKSSSPLIT